MRYRISTTIAPALLVIVAAGVVTARIPRLAHETVPELEEFDSCIQERFRDTRTFGLSRLITFNVLGTHFRRWRRNEPFTRVSDFLPESKREAAIISRLESANWMLGLYVFGDSVRVKDASEMAHRALKGPARITTGTHLSSNGMPHMRVLETPSPETSPTSQRAGVPSWKSVYPFARDAMNAFRGGASKLDREIDDWGVSARVVRASSNDCVACHNEGVASVGNHSPKQLGEALGSVIYLYRQARQ